MTDPYKADPAIDRWQNMHSTMYQRFRLTPSKTRAVVFWGFAVPLLTYYAAQYTDVSRSSFLNESCAQRLTLFSCCKSNASRTDGSCAERLVRTRCFATLLPRQQRKLTRSRPRSPSTLQSTSFLEMLIDEIAF